MEMIPNMTEITTLDGLISRNDRYDINKIAYFETVMIDNDDGIVTIDTDLFTVYMRFIRDYVNVYKVTEEQRQIYRYKPFLLSSDIYGTPDLAWLILKLNDIESPSKFHLRKTVKLISISNLELLYDSIITKSTAKLSRNWKENLMNITQ